MGALDIILDTWFCLTVDIQKPNQKTIVEGEKEFYFFPQTNFHIQNCNIKTSIDGDINYTP